MATQHIVYPPQPATVSSAITGLTGDVVATGPGTASAVVIAVGGQSAADIALSVQATESASAINDPNALVLRDGTGSFVAENITAEGAFIGNLTGNAATATFAASSGAFTGNLAGDVTGPQSSTVVAFVGTKSAAAVDTSVVLTQAATDTNIGSTIVRRSAGGSASLDISGNATNITGTLAVAQGGTGSTTTTGSGSNVLSNSPTLVTPALGTPSAAVLTNATGLPIAAGTTGTLPVNRGGTNSSAALTNNRVIVSTAGALVESAVTSTELGYLTGVTSGLQAQLNGKQASGNYITALTGDVSAAGPGSAAATVASVGGQTAANVAAGAVLANASTALNTASAIIRRGASGEFSAAGIVATASGNVGIGGITSPLVPLDVASGPTAPSIKAGSFELQSIGTNNCWLGDNIYFDGNFRYRVNGSGVLSYFSGADYYLFFAGPGLAGAVAPLNARMVVQNGGSVGIGTAGPTSLLSVNGTADKVGGGSWGTFSDACLKDEQGEFEYGLDAINALRTIRYTFKVDNILGQSPDKEHVGFIAQEVQRAIPEAVTTVQCSTHSDSTAPLKEILTLNQDHIILALVNAVQELSNRLAALEDYDMGGNR